MTTTRTLRGARAGHPDVHFAKTKSSLGGGVEGGVVFSPTALTGAAAAVSALGRQSGGLGATIEDVAAPSLGR